MGAAPTCTSLAKIRLVVTGGGFCRAKAQASCDVRLFEIHNEFVVGYVV